MRRFFTVLLLALLGCGDEDTTTRLDVRISYGFVDIGEVQRVDFRGNGRMQEVAGQPAQITIRLADESPFELEVRALDSDGSLVGSRVRSVTPILGQAVQVDIVLASALCDPQCGAGETCVIDTCLSTDAGTQDAGTDALTMEDAFVGLDAALDTGVDAGVDGGMDAGVDAGMDAGVDGGMDAGVDGGPDAGTYPCRNERGTILFESFELPAAEPIALNTTIGTDMAPCGESFIRVGADGHFYFSNNEAFNGAGSLDFFAYLPTGDPVNFVVSRGSNGSNPGDFLVFIDAGVTVAVRGTVPAVRCSGLVSRNEWHHIGINFGPELRLWVDGSLAMLETAFSETRGTLPESFECGTGNASFLAGDNPLVFGADQRRSDSGSHLPVFDEFEGLRIDQVRWSDSTIDYGR